MQLRKILHISLFTFALFLITSCDTTNPQNNEKVTLTAEDASCTEVWLNVKTKNISLPTEVRITQDDSTVITTNINKGDTTLIVEKLQPNRAYTFKSVVEKDKLTSQAQITTMDTTSHNFTWETFTFGDRSSVLNDVAIINENNIWAVGEIHTKDTDKFDKDSNWVQPYNAVHWDGSTWELKRIMLYIDPFQPGAGRTASVAESIFSFSENDFVVSSNAQIAFFNQGGNYTVKKIDFKWKDLYTITSIWGTSNKDFYAVGNGGNITHYNGSSWTKIESGTETQIRDIWGYRDKITGNSRVLCAVSNVITHGDNKILEIKKNNSVNEISWDTGDIDKRVNSLWFNSTKQLFTCGGGVFISRQNGLWEKQPLPSIHTNKIRGVDRNDIFVAGDFGLVAHFNGVSWKVYSNANIALFYSLDYKENLSVLVGERNNKAVILKMRKQ